MAEDFANQHRQRAACGFKFVALMFQPFDLGQNFAQFGRVIGKLDAQFPRLHHDVAAPGQIADEHVARIADAAGSMCS